MVGANPFLGVTFHWIGGLAAGSFYVLYKGVRKWAWETYWLVGGFFSWIIAPWILAFILVPHLGQVLAAASPSVLFWMWFWGAMWGLGGLTFGLSMRYLGMSLGMAVALGFCAAFGTLMPPIFDGTLVEKLHTTSGIVVLIGIAVCLAGIAIAGIAGISKESELPEEEKKKTTQEFNFARGIAVAVFAGIMSASMSYGLAAGAPLATAAGQYGAEQIWAGLPKLIIVLFGGFTSNFIWCVFLNIKNRTGRQYFDSAVRSVPHENGFEPMLENVTDAPGEEMAKHAPTLSAISKTSDTGPAPMLQNYLLSAAAGTIWYLQFFFYTMGETQMGKFKFSSWTLHMASIIIFSTLWGIGLKEWRGTSIRTKALLTLGLAVLIASTIIVGYGNYLEPDRQISR